MMYTLYLTYLLLKLPNDLFDQDEIQMTIFSMHPHPIENSRSFMLEYNLLKPWENDKTLSKKTVWPHYSRVTCMLPTNEFFTVYTTIL